MRLIGMQSTFCLFMQRSLLKVVDIVVEKTIILQCNQSNELCLAGTLWGFWPSKATLSNSSRIYKYRHISPFRTFKP